MESKSKPSSALSVTKADINSRYGDNKIPSSGWATFSDEKSYYFSCSIEQNEKGEWVQGEHFGFTASRKRDGVWERVPFKSAKRSAALVAFLNQ